MGVTGAGFGGLAFIIRGIAEQTCGGRVIITLEGGYNPEGLREGVRAVLNTFLQPRAAADIPAAPTAGRVIQMIISHHKKYWESLR